MGKNEVLKLNELKKLNKLNRGADFVREATFQSIRAQKRHRAAALHDACANSKAPLFPPGFGVRQPYAALASVGRSKMEKDLLKPEMRSAV
jgi:hypothetical protein